LFSLTDEIDEAVKNNQQLEEKNKTSEVSLYKSLIVEKRMKHLLAQAQATWTQTLKI